MIRSTCVGTVAFFWFAGIVAAQPLSVPSAAASHDWQTPRVVRAVAARVQTESVKPSSDQPARSFEAACFGSSVVEMDTREHGREW